MMDPDNRDWMIRAFRKKQEELATGALDYINTEDLVEAFDKQNDSPE